MDVPADLANNDDLYKALDMFGEGLKQYQVGQAVNEASGKLAQLKAQNLKEADELKQKAEIGNLLSLRLTGVGASAEQIEGATRGLVVPGTTQATNQFQGQSQEKKQKFDAEQGALERENKLQIAGIRTQAQNKINDKTVKFLKDQNAQFQKIAGPAIDSLNNINLAKESLSSGNPIADTAVVNFLARASSEKGPLTESDKAQFGGSKAFTDRAAQFAENLKSGKLTDKNRAFATQLLNIYEKTQTSNLKQARTQVSKRAMVSVQAGGLPLTEDQVAESLWSDKAAPKVLSKKLYSPSANKTKLIYSDGSEEVVEGKR